MCGVYLPKKGGLTPLVKTKKKYVKNKSTKAHKVNLRKVRLRKPKLLKVKPRTKPKHCCFKKKSLRKISQPAKADVIKAKISDVDVSIFNIASVEDPLIGTPKEVRKELDVLALKMQRHPNNNDCFNKIHFYIHKYLLGLVFKKFSFIKGQDESDMYQESLIALFKKAIPKFNPNKGMSFLNFAKMCITRHLITILHASKHRKKDIPINTAISMDHSPVSQDNNETEMAPLSNVIADDNNKTLPYKRMSDKETFNQTLESIKSKLSSFEVVVLEEYLNEKSYREVAKGVSKRLEIKYDAKSIDNALLRIRKKAHELVNANSEDVVPLLFS